MMLPTNHMAAILNMLCFVSVALVFCVVIIVTMPKKSKMSANKSELDPCILSANEQAELKKLNQKLKPKKQKDITVDQASWLLENKDIVRNLGKPYLNKFRLNALRRGFWLPQAWKSVQATVDRYSKIEVYLRMKLKTKKTFASLAPKWQNHAFKILSKDHVLKADVQVDSEHWSGVVTVPQDEWRIHNDAMNQNEIDQKTAQKWSIRSRKSENEKNENKKQATESQNKQNHQVQALMKKSVERAAKDHEKYKNKEQKLVNEVIQSQMQAITGSTPQSVILTNIINSYSQFDGVSEYAPLTSFMIDNVTTLLKYHRTSDPGKLKLVMEDCLFRIRFNDITDVNKHLPIWLTFHKNNPINVWKEILKIRERQFHSLSMPLPDGTVAEPVVDFLQIGDISDIEVDTWTDSENEESEEKADELTDTVDNTNVTAEDVERAVNNESASGTSNEGQVENENESLNDEEQINTFLSQPPSDDDASHDEETSSEDDDIDLIEQDD